MIPQIILYILLISNLVEGRIHVTGTTKKVNGVVLQNLDDMMVNAAMMTRLNFKRTEMSWWDRMWDRTDYLQAGRKYSVKVDAEEAKLKRNLHGIKLGRGQTTGMIANSLNKLVRAGNVIAHQLSERSYISQSDMARVKKQFVEASRVLAKTFTESWLENIHQCYLAQYFYQINKDYLKQVRYNKYLNALSGQRAESRVCAKEGETCSCKNGSVKYGAVHKWSRSKTVKGSIRCDNKTFGDVYRGVKKFCVCRTPLLTHRSNFRRFMTLVEQETVEDLINMEDDDFLAANEFQGVMNEYDVEESFESPNSDMNDVLELNEFEDVENFESFEESNEFEVSEDEEVTESTGIFNFLQSNEFEDVVVDESVDESFESFDSEATVDEAEIDEAEGFNFESLVANEFEGANEPEIDFGPDFNFHSDTITNEFEGANEPEIDVDDFNFNSDTITDEVQSMVDANESESVNFYSIAEANDDFNSETNNEVPMPLVDANEFEGLNFDSIDEPEIEVPMPLVDANEFEGLNFDSVDEPEIDFNFDDSMAEVNDNFNFDSEPIETDEELPMFDANEFEGFNAFETIETNDVQPAAHEEFDFERDITAYM